MPICIEQVQSLVMCGECALFDVFYFIELDGCEFAGELGGIVLAVLGTCEQVSSHLNYIYTNQLIKIWPISKK